MNKQEALKKIEKLDGLTIKDKDFNFDIEMIPKGETLEIIEQLDEPEKVSLSKEEAEWINNLKRYLELPDLLYYITRCGYDGNGFTFPYWGDVYELPIKENTDFSEVNAIRKRLMNAVIYGYEVEKEKLYTVEIPNPNRADVSLVLGLYNDGKVAIFAVFIDSWKYEKRYKLTEAEIKEDFEWAWQFAKEVEE